MEIPNQPLEIYRGGLKAEFKGVAVHGKGKIFLRWMPMPEIWFELQFCDECGLVPPEDITSGEATGVLLKTSHAYPGNYLEITGTPAHVVSEKHFFPAKGKFRSMMDSISVPNELAGNISFPPYIGSCDFIKFYIPNFKKFQNLQLIDTEWTATIDAVDFVKRPDDELDILRGRMEKSGGFIISHKGTLKRTDESEFAFSEGIDCLQAIYFFTSFMSGTWCGPILARNVFNKRIVWQGGVPDHLTPWTYRRGCLEGSMMAGNQKLFENFMIEWRDKEKQEVNKILVQWYVEANLNAGWTEGSIVLVHSALELLANLSGYEKRKEEPAFCMIRRLIRDLKISPDLTEKQKYLQNVYDNNKYKLKKNNKSDMWDGPSILSELRNAIVHVKGKKLDRPPLREIPIEAREEALDLGLYYLELCILNRLEHAGQYFNRVNLKHESVPWS